MFTDPLYNWILYVGVGMVLLLTILAIVRLSERATLFIAEYFRPCWITVAGLALGLTGYFYFYDTEQYAVTVLCMVLSGAFDLADGPVGRAWDKKYGLREIKGRLAQFNHHGTTLFGASLDPLVDKAVTGSIFVHMAWTVSEMISRGLDHWTAYLLVAQLMLVTIVDIAGQFLRGAQTDKRAELIGKIKSPAQRIWMLFFPVLHKGWTSEPETYLLFLNALLVVVLGFTVMSASKKLLLIWRARQMGHLV